MSDTFSILLNKWRKGPMTLEEARQFAEAIRSGQYDEQVTEAMEKEAELQEFAQRVIAGDKIKDWQKIEESLHSTISIKPAHRIYFLKTAWFRVAVAVIIIIGISTYLWLQPSTDTPAITQTQPVPAKNEVLPGTDRAILTLADGRKLQLDSNANAVLAEKGISNENALIAYSSTAKERVMNTLSTPKAGQYKIRLSDGTMVWLNAASSITYPTAFHGPSREVLITGEAYFEVAPNKSTPFIVKTHQEEIVVLGTSFNVNRYTDDSAGKISLMEGAVKIGTAVLKPGQAYTNGKVAVTDLQQDIAWKNGVFNFNNTRLKEAMKQIARWYDVEVRYEGNIQEIMLGGKIGRRLTLEQLLRGLEGIDDVHFQLSGRTLIVKP